MGDRHQQNGVNYTLDLNTGLTQVLTDGTNTYLYGNGRIAQTNSTTEYFLGDALGSVRQMADPAGVVTLTQSYAPYGDVVSSVGTSQTDYAFTGESRDANGLTYLRARYYAPQDGRFISRDTWSGEYNRPTTLNRWQYGYSNPVLYTDPSGYRPPSPKVSCSNVILPDLKTLCYLANRHDGDPNTIDARRKFFSRVAFYSVGASGIGGEGYFWSGAMLKFFLDGRVNNVDINLPTDTSFGSDAGIIRATKIKTGTKFGDEPLEITPLLYVFLQKHMEQSLFCAPKYSAQGDYSVASKDTWSGEHSPRPHNKGWWGAFGHVEPNATYSNTSTIKVSGGYRIQTDVTYNIEDNYGWFEGKTTPFGPPIASPAIWIPHEWELSLVDHGGAVMFDFTITWREKLSIFLSSDFSYFRVDGANLTQDLE